MGREPTGDRARALSDMLVGWPSVTGTAGEASFTGKLVTHLRTDQYFARHPADLVQLPVPGDALGRSSLLALVRGHGRRTVLLCGHFDVVSEEGYGDLVGLARAPEALRHALIKRLEAAGSDAQALADLASGEFIPGRGMLDMKSGLAAGLCVLEQFAAAPDVGNLLFVATPDEEDRSVGMRAVADMLPAFLRERDLEPVLAINLDAICDDGDGAAGRVVAMGCLGKLLLSALVVGREAHAAYPFAGVNAAYLAAELTTELECAPALADLSDGELAAPPSVLGARDGKTAYDVTVPAQAWLFWNVLVHRRTAAEVLAVAKACAEAGVARASARMRDRAAALGQAAAVTEAWSSIPVLSFAALLDRARRRDAGFEARFGAEAERLAADGRSDLPERSRQLTRLAWNASGLAGPAVVLGFASMPYPAIAWADGESPVAQAIVTAIAAVAAECGVTIRRQHYFPAIADMSFIGPVDQADLAEAARNTPVWGTSIRWDLAGAATPAIPAINIGPWGRDYHHWLERAHGDYAFRVLPRLVAAVARAVLAADDDR